MNLSKDDFADNPRKFRYLKREIFLNMKEPGRVSFYAFLRPIFSLLYVLHVAVFLVLDVQKYLSVYIFLEITSK